MLSIKSIASKLGFGTGVVEQASIVAGSSIKEVASKTYNGVSSHNYRADLKEFNQAFSNGRQDGKEFVNSRKVITKEELKELVNRPEVNLITL